MRIDSLHLTNFRSHADTTLKLGRLNIVRGLNASGKSSIQMAIEYALTGRCLVTDAAGRGADALIRHGASQFSVELEAESGYRVQASRSKSGGNLIVSNGKQNFAGKAAQAQIEAQLGALPVLSAVLNAGRFLEMSAAEQKALLAGALASEPVEIAKDIQALMLSLAFAARESVGSPADVDCIYKAAYTERTNCNRELKALGELQAPEIPADIPPLQSVQAKISDLEASHRRTLQQRQKKLSDHEAAKRSQQENVFRSQRLEVEARQLKGDCIATGEEMQGVDKTAKGAKTAAKSDAEIARLEAEIKAKGAAILGWRKAPTVCDKCGAPLALTKAAINEKIAALEAESQELSGELEKARAARAKLGDPAAAAERLARHKRAMDRIAAIDSELAECSAGNLPEALDLSQEDGELQQLEERITKGRAVELQLIELEGKRQQHEQAAAKQQKLQQQSAALDRLCDYFGDKGPLKAKLVGGRLPAFVQRLNGTLQRFGFFCQFELEPYQLLINPGYESGELAAPGDHAHWHWLQQLSESEAYRFAIAFQVSLAEATGVGLVIIDRADMLTAQARRFLTQALEESRLDQAIVLATGEPAGNYPQITGVKFFELATVNGVTEITFQSAAAIEAEYVATG